MWYVRHAVIFKYGMLLTVDKPGVLYVVMDTRWTIENHGTWLSPVVIPIYNNPSIGTIVFYFRNAINISSNSSIYECVVYNTWIKNVEQHLIIMFRTIHTEVQLVN